MILVDVYVPAIDKVYDFKLDETVPVSIVIENMVELICQKEQCLLKGNVSQMMLWYVGGCCRLYGGQSLYENGIQSGMQLLLI